MKNNCSQTEEETRLNNLDHGLCLLWVQASAAGKNILSYSKRLHALKALNPQKTLWRHEFNHFPTISFFSRATARHPLSRQRKASLAPCTQEEITAFSLCALGDFTLFAVSFCKRFLSSAAFEVLWKMEIIRHVYFHWHGEAEAWSERLCLCKKIIGPIKCTLFSEVQTP